MRIPACARPRAGTRSARRHRSGAGSSASKPRSRVCLTPPRSGDKRLPPIGLEQLAVAMSEMSVHGDSMDPRRSFQGLILALQRFWADYGCVILQPYDMEVGAGTFHPA